MLVSRLKSFRELVASIQRDIEACGEDIEGAEKRAMFRLLNYCPPSKEPAKRQSDGQEPE